MRVNVDGDEVVLVLVECNLERVEDETNVGFLKTVKRNEFFLELVSKDFFGSVQGAPIPI